MPVQSVQSIDFRYFTGKVFILNRKAPEDVRGFLLISVFIIADCVKLICHAYVIDWTWFDGVGGLTRFSVVDGIGLGQESTPGA